MKIQAIKTNALQRKIPTFRPHGAVFAWVILGFLLIGAASTTLQAATLDEDFGPLSLLKGGRPVQRGCGRPMAACTCCGHEVDKEMNMDMGGPVVDSGIRLGGGDLDASPPQLTVTNVGTSAYSINGVNNPILTLVRGETYTFNITANGHPFYIKTVQGPAPATRMPAGSLEIARKSAPSPPRCRRMRRTCFSTTARTMLR